MEPAALVVQVEMWPTLAPVALWSSSETGALNGGAPGGFLARSESFTMPGVDARVDTTTETTRSGDLHRMRVAVVVHCFATQAGMAPTWMVKAPVVCRT